MSHPRLLISLSAGLAAALVYHSMPPQSTADWFYANQIPTNCDRMAASYLNNLVPGSPYSPASGCAAPNVGALCGFCDGGVTFREPGMGWQSPGSLDGRMPGVGPNCGDLMQGTCGYVGPSPTPPTYGWGCTNQIVVLNSDGQIYACGNPVAAVSQRTGE